MSLVQVVTAGVACLCAWFLFPGLREEAGLVVGLLSRGDLEGVRAYVLSFGAWAPAVSIGMMVLQGVLAPIPAFAITSANGLVFGAFWGSVVGLAGRCLAALVCFYLPSALAPNTGGSPGQQTLLIMKIIRFTNPHLLLIMRSWGTNKVVKLLLITGRRVRWGQRRRIDG